MAEGSQPAEGESPAGTETQPETFNAPISALGAGVKEGDSVTCQVVSVDEQSGVATLVVGAPEAESAGGADGMASEFAGAGPSSASQMQSS